MNCWEAVLLAGWQAGVITWEAIHQLNNGHNPKPEDEQISAWDERIGALLDAAPR